MQDVRGKIILLNRYQSYSATPAPKGLGLKTWPDNNSNYEQKNIQLPANYVLYTQDFYEALQSNDKIKSFKGLLDFSQTLDLG
ncbi:hypothetical protein FACS1894218_1380 [Bacilli bacterium]|nr:hypothetical protein FACS1894218_1380 [Bacilli bacterium]